MINVKGKKWDEYISRKRDEELAKLEALLGRNREVRKKKEVVRFTVIAPAHGILFKSLKGSDWKLGIFIPPEFKRLEGRVRVWIEPVSIKYDKKTVLVRVVDWKEVRE